MFCDVITKYTDIFVEKMREAFAVQKLTFFQQKNIGIFGLNTFISENNIHGNYNIVIYINIIGLERKQYSLFWFFS